MYGQGRSVIGTRVGFAGFDLPASEIVGVISDRREDALAAPAYPYGYKCASGGAWPDPERAVRVTNDPRGAMNAIRKLVRQVAPGPIFGKQMLEESLEATLDRPRSDARLLLGFAFAAVARYGLVAQIVNACATTLECEWLSGHHPGKWCHRWWRTPAAD